MDEVISLRMSKKTMRELKEIAVEQRRTISNLIRNILQDWLMEDRLAERRRRAQKQ